MNPRHQGDLGEVSALHWFVNQDIPVYVPFGHSPDTDLIAELDGRLARVQVKTSTVFQRNRWHVAVRTSGGNQSWSRIIKRMDASRCDYLFVHVGDGRRWLIPIREVGGGCSILLGGPRYAAFEIEPGAPIPSSRIAA
jgi:hypothetical protein